MFLSNDKRESSGICVDACPVDAMFQYGKVFNNITCDEGEQVCPNTILDGGYVVKGTKITSPIRAVKIQRDFEVQI